MTDNTSKGLRVIRFKDFVVDVSGTTPSTWRAPWSVYNDNGGSWSIVAGNAPYVGIDNYGNRYYVGGPPTIGGQSDILQSAAYGWLDTDQSPNGARNGVQYDVMIRVVDGQAFFMFMWDSSGLSAYRVRVVPGEGVFLEKSNGVGQLYLEDTWFTLASDTECTIEADTDYWLRIEYFPQDISSENLKDDIDVAGLLQVFVDTSHFKQGLGEVAYIRYQDTYPLTSGDKIALGRVDATEVYFDGIEFCDGWLMGFEQFLLKKDMGPRAISQLMFNFVYDPELTCIEAGDRVELWVKNVDKDMEAYRVCDFDGVVKRVEWQEGGNDSMVGNAYAVDELKEFMGEHREHNVDTSFGDYFGYLQNQLIGEHGYANLKRTAFTRFHLMGVNSSALSFAISANYNIAITDYDFISLMSWICNAWFTWNPEGFFIMTSGSIPTGIHINLTSTVSGLPHRVLYYKIRGDLLELYTRVKLLSSSTTSYISTDPARRAQYGSSDYVMVNKKLPATEAQEVADNILAAYSEDTYPHLDLYVLGNLSKIQPGMQINVTLPGGVFDDVPMIVTQKILFNGADISEDEDPWLVQNVVKLRLAYYDTSVTKLPRLLHAHSEQSYEEARMRRMERVNFL